MFSAGPDHKDEGPVWELLPVSEFFTFNIPFEVEGTTTVCVHFQLFKNVSDPKNSFSLIKHKVFSELRLSSCKFEVFKLKYIKF